MKRLLWVFTVLLGASGAASGQDISGAYFGASLGQSSGTGRWDFPPFGTAIDTGPSGWLASLKAGLNFQSGSTVFGVEVDGGSGPLESTMGCPNALFDCKTEVSWLGTLRGRLGIVNQTALVYATGGAAAGGVKLSAADNIGAGLSDHSSKTQVGWAAGVGIASSKSHGWAWNAEWLHVDLGKANYTVLGSDVSFKYKTDILRVGLDYRF